MMLLKRTFVVVLLVLDRSFVLAGQCPQARNRLLEDSSDSQASRALNGWFPCGTNTYCVTNRATCAVGVDDIGTCTCMPGYAGTDCQPVNECETEFPCPGGSVCVDMFPPERFKCVCTAGFTPFLPTELPAEPEVTLAYRPIRCLDQNECEAGASPCHPDAICTNTIGRFECICKEGLVGNGITTCEEPVGVDTVTEEAPPDGSCQVSTDCQGANMDCADFQCLCLPGYAMVGANCQSEVHCDPGGLNNDCHRRATCSEEEGFPGFSCACIEGWEDAFEGAKGTACKDIPSVTDAPPEPITESTALPEGVGPHPNRPTVFPPTCLAEGASCSTDGAGGTCCTGSCMQEETGQLLDFDPFVQDPGVGGPVPQVIP